MFRTVTFKYLFNLITFFTFFFSYSQEKGFVIPDSLKNKSFGEIRTNFIKNSKNKKLSILYAKSLLKKGKVENNTIYTAEGYRLMFVVEKDHEKRLKYIDSAIVVSKNSKHFYYPAILFMNKGVAFSEKGQYGVALENYLEAIHYSKIVKNEDYIYYNLHNIGLLKRKLGEYSEAINIFNQCMKFEEFKKNKTSADSISYVLTGIELSKTLTLSNQIDSSEYYIKKVTPFLTNKNDEGFYALYFNKGLNEYFKKNYQLSIDILNECVDYASKNKMALYFDEEFFLKVYYYLAENYSKIKDKNKAILFAKKIDSCFESHKIPSKEIRKAYEILMKYYKEKKESKKQLFYIEKLLSVDSLLLNDYKALNKSMNKEFDTPNLINEKEEVIFSLRKTNKRSNNGLLILTVLLIFVGLIAWFYYQRQQTYKQRFEELVNIKEPTVINDDEKIEKKSVNINENVLKQILSTLEEFERDKKFTARKITLASLAKDFETNPRYLSLVVNEYKNKSFSNYMTDLRINYAIDKLKTDKIFRKYAIKAIAFDVGFNNAQSFSNAFYKKTGIYPSYFIKKLSESKS